MTVLTRWDPFRELTTLQNRMSRLFEEQYGSGREDSLTTGAFVPAVLLAYVAYRITAALADIPMRMTVSNLALALGLAAAVSLFSALLTVGKLRAADPAELY